VGSPHSPSVPPPLLCHKLWFFAVLYVFSGFPVSRSPIPYDSSDADSLGPTSQPGHLPLMVVSFPGWRYHPLSFHAIFFFFSFPIVTESSQLQRSLYSYGLIELGTTVCPPIGTLGGLLLCLTTFFPRLVSSEIRQTPAYR